MNTSPDTSLWHIIETALWALGALFLLLVVLVTISAIVAAFEVKKEREDYFKSDWKKDLRNLLILIPMLFLFSCSTSKNFEFTRLRKSGTYTVATRHGRTTTFKEVTGKYSIKSDTLKVGDEIPVIVFSGK